MQVAATTMSEAEWSDGIGKEFVVGDIMWPLANILWRIYAEVYHSHFRPDMNADMKVLQRKLHTQATELQKTFSATFPHEDKRISSRGRFIRQTDVCQSYYWRGRLGVVLLDMRGAKYWLDKAWSLCPEEAKQQRRWVQPRRNPWRVYLPEYPPTLTLEFDSSILIKLIPVNLLLGQQPSQLLLLEHRLEGFFPLLQYFRQGNVKAFRREIYVNREWFRRRSIWLLLFERGEILVWRNLFRRR